MPPTWSSLLSSIPSSTLWLSWPARNAALELDIGTTRVEGTFSFGYVVFNTIMNLGRGHADRVLRKRRRASAAGRPVRRRDHGPGCPTPLRVKR
jgi:hypothetical protein